MQFVGGAREVVENSISKRIGYISRRNKSYDEKIATVLVFRLGNRIKEGTIRRAGDPI